MCRTRLCGGTGTEWWDQDWDSVGLLIHCRENQANPPNLAAPAGAHWHPALVFKGPHAVGLGLLLPEAGPVLVCGAVPGVAGE